MKPSRFCLSAGLILAGLAAIPVSAIFGETIIDQAIKSIGRAKIAMCNKTFTQCTTGCSAYASIAQLYNNCMSDCSSQFSQCMGSVRAAAAADANPTGSRPPVAPPTRNPTKVSPGRVTGVSPDKATSTSSPGGSLRSGSGRRTEVKDSNDRHANEVPPATGMPTGVRRNISPAKAQSSPAVDKRSSKTSPTATPRKAQKK